MLKSLKNQGTMGCVRPGRALSSLGMEGNHVIAYTRGRNQSFLEEKYWIWWRRSASLIFSLKT